MAISGGIKFFTPNKININSDMVASSGDSSTLYIADENYFTNWRSSGSNDSTSETITITFDTAISIDRLLLSGHNWKNFSIKYNTSSDFSSVISLDSTGLSEISETAYSRDTSYYEFDSVSVTTIDITINTTQAADQEKYLRQLKIFNEIGTFQGYPVITDITVDKGLIVEDLISRRRSIQKQFDVFSMNLSFENYPVSSTYSADLDLVMTLFDYDTPFYVWVCGGRFGTSYFKHTLRGFRLRDIILCDISDDISQNYKNNVYINPVNLNISLRETASND